MQKSSVSAEQKSLAMTVTPAELNTLEEDPAQGLRKKAQPTLSRLEKFLGFDVVTRAEIAKIFLTGTIAGFGVVGMRKLPSPQSEVGSGLTLICADYIGQASITGIPYIAYKPAYVVGSVIIAAGAVIIALYIMFIMLRPKLKHNWASKIVVAAILAIAVCCMHFCGESTGRAGSMPRGG
jgi:NO-binding membrane sensor protein with MHYT domain